MKQKFLKQTIFNAIIVIVCLKEILFYFWFLLKGYNSKNNEDEYEEAYNVWELVRTEGEGYEAISNGFRIHNITKEQIMSALGTHEENRFNIFNIKYVWQVENLQKFIPDHNIDLSKYGYHLALIHEPRFYTMNGIKKLVAKNDFFTLNYVLLDKNIYRRSHDEIVDCLKLIGNFRMPCMREDRQHIINFILSRDININDDLLLTYLEEGLNDLNYEIMLLTQCTIVNILQSKKPHLYEQLNNKYDLYLAKADTRDQIADIVKYILINNLNPGSKTLFEYIEKGLNDPDLHLRIKMKKMVINELKFRKPLLYLKLISIYDLSLPNDVMKYNTARSI